MSGVVNMSLSQLERTVSRFKILFKAKMDLFCNVEITIFGMHVFYPQHAILPNVVTNVMLIRYTSTILVYLSIKCGRISEMNNETP